ncbi:ABC transporter substrate-binding protein [Streptomyces endophyticus]|uniref:ABC transporter substrate-binding protein n=1 Tax=Streptomyces endophyticus TaxID=714166 RepID=A0ABU6F619_9ACTN|nr:ABC transporter substrate-binding protein [Streptomyces endophyticus]MEB8338277.1 ABC transporter substrate-binding protein [Streptomyces endophyticus]
MERSRRATMVAALTLLTWAAATGCGAGTEQAELPSSKAALAKQAAQEGVVNWASWNPEAQMQPAIDLFEKKYPHIKVKYTNVKAPDQVSRLKVEQAARKVSIDVANAGGLTMTPAVKLAGDVDWAAYGVADKDIFAKNFVYVWATPKVWAYNTDQVKPADAPKSWDDLLDSKWAGGRISAESRASFMSVWDLNGSMGETKALAWAKKFGALKPHYSPNVTQAEAPIESGEVAIGTSLASLVLAAKDKGAPVAIAPVSPTSASESYLYVPKGAPHPAAAALLTSFLSSDAAQRVLAKTYNSRIPVDTDCSDPGDTPVLQAMCEADLTWYGTKTLGKYKTLSGFYPKAEKEFGTDVG